MMARERNAGGLRPSSNMLKTEDAEDCLEAAFEMLMRQDAVQLTKQVTLRLWITGHKSEYRGSMPRLQASWT